MGEGGRSRPMSIVSALIRSRRNSNAGIFIPCPAGQESTGLLLSCPAPLLEEKSDAVLPARVAQLLDPPGLHWPRLRPGLAAHDRPMNVGEVRIDDRAQQRLERDEPHAHGDAAQNVDAVQI